MALREQLSRLLSSPWRVVALIVLGNLVPVAGVAFWGWSATQILLLYWVENVIIGVLTLPRILTAKGSAPSGAMQGAKMDSPLSLGCFFIVHYGIFCIGHLLFALVLAGRLSRDDSPAVSYGGFWWAVVALAAVQVILFVREWWLSGLWRRSSPIMEMFRPYGRIFVMHITVLVGAWGLSLIDAPTQAILVLAIGKMVLELITERLTRPRQG